MVSAKHIIKKKMDDYYNLKELMIKTPGYLGKYTDYLFNGVLYDDLKFSYNELMYVRERGKRIDISNLSFEQLRDKIQKEKEKVIVKSLINKFPREQKNYIKKYIKQTYRGKSLMLELYHNGNVSKLIPKISRYHDQDSLVNAIQMFSKNVNKSKKEVMKTINSLPSVNLIYNDKDLILIEVFNSEDMDILGSGTSWCIVNSKSTFNRYLNKGKQFILYNYNKDEFDPYFQIGFNVNQRGGIEHAHNSMDSYCKSEIEKILEENSEISLKEMVIKTSEDELEKKIASYRIGSGLSGVKWRQVISRFTREECIKWINRFVKYYSYSDNLRECILSKFTESLFKEEDYDYVLRKDVSDIMIEQGYVSEVFDHVDDQRKIDELDFSFSYINYKITEKALLNNVWKDDSIIKTIRPNTLFYQYNNKGYKDNLTDSKSDRKKKKILLSISNSLNKVYERNYDKYDQVDLDNLSMSIIYLYKICGKSIPKSSNLNKVYDKLVGDKFRKDLINKKSFDISFDLGEVEDMEKLNLINKKDYSDIELTIGNDIDDHYYIYYYHHENQSYRKKSSYKEMNKIINHLKDNKLIFRLDIKSLSNFNRPKFKKKKNKINDSGYVLYDLIKSIPITSRISESFKSGNITIILT